ncbi:MAG: hypothetical protein GX895_14935 [Clostridiales bacterium]|uniref:PRK06851 family protein n=1 Tax=Clostridium sp. N3C TaxID=1776758 RepID=UPI00092DFF17|nr:PRK06851 family protein [Clostridium sp. N3C]NLZ50045.1 hypothetical protein [Clostridiales bacterium]SCN25299.1 NACHT domain protein [Clostridium sp. N3C]
MPGKVLNYYAEGNTSRGFYNLYETNLQGLDRIFILKGASGKSKSTLMKSLAEEWIDKDYDVEIINCPRDNDLIDGIIIPKLKVAVINGKEPDNIKAKLPGVIEQYIDISEALDSSKLEKHKDELIELTEEIEANYELAYSKFAEALKIHDEWEEVYIENMEFSKANAIAEELIEKFFAGKRLKKEAVVKHRFLGAATPKGSVDFVPNITEQIGKRYFIKGRPGTGKSSLLKKLVAQAEKRGFDVEVYHCGFDPLSLDMVLFRELDIVIFDSTSPHEYFPSRESDEVVDMYEIVVTSGTDEKYASKLDDIKKRYKKRIKEGTAALLSAKELNDTLEQYFVSAMDFSKVNKIRDRINSYIKTKASLNKN